DYYCSSFTTSNTDVF
nr:immunoglobulin light chain junction region [Macaca mulatta]MOX77834.1 immunoglobulin light chain junction region [Macaca mulatta]MOX77864.1 immunoglobulin light chain junction region [Macaca mulatta]MOX78063.1 immunoglobulin light chain junction region [Macaca mulatta]MOX78469.1 immunoglobulin light chain junction region [Macaca mulatta]